MKKLITISVILMLGLSKLMAQAVNTDSIKHSTAVVSDSIKTAVTHIAPIDTLKHPLIIVADSVKTPVNNIANTDSVKHKFFITTDSVKNPVVNVANNDSTKHKLLPITDSVKSVAIISIDTTKNKLLTAADSVKTPSTHIANVDTLKQPAAVTDSAKAIVSNADTLKHHIAATTDSLKVPLVNIDSLKHQLVLTSDSLKAPVNSIDTLRHLALIVSDTLKAPVENADTLERQIVFAGNSLKAIHEKTDSLQQRLLTATGLLRVHLKNTDSLQQQLVFASNLLKPPLIPADTVKQQILLASTSSTTAPNTIDSLKQQLGVINKALKASVNTDSLKRRLAFTVDTVKGKIYTRLAAESLKHDTAINKLVYYQEESLAYTMKALHFYSACNDSIGLRISFDNLAHVYHDEKKYSEAKWFILQSNTLSRQKNDVPNIITSLIELASIKTDIKDYNLAMGDLNEALKLSVSHHFSRDESIVQLSYATLYDKMGNEPKAALALKRHDFIDDSIRREERALILAKIKAANALLAKKKIYAASYSKHAKTNAGKPAVSL